MTPPIVSAGAAPAADWAGLLLPLCAVAGRVLLSATFLHAGVQKIRHYALLVGVVSNYKVLPEALAPWAARLLPPLELCLGVALLIPTSGSGLVAAGLLLLFTAALITNLVRGRTYIDCGCFQSGLRQELGWELVWRNGGLTGLALYSACFPVHLTWAVGLMAVLFGLVGYTLLQALNALAANRSALRSLTAR